MPNPSAVAARTADESAQRSGRPDPVVPDGAAPVPAPTIRPGGRGVALGWAVALVVVAVAFVVRAARYGSWLVDDALISLAYARTLSLGGGLAEQPGAAPVEGVSNITWTLLLAGLRSLGLLDAGHVWFGYDDYVVVIRALGLVFFLGTVVAVGLAARAVVGARLAPLAAGVAGLLLVMSPPYLTWAIGGLENPLYGFLVAVLAAVVVITWSRRTLLTVRTAMACSLLAVLAAATRPDGAIYLAVYPVAAVLAVRGHRFRRLLGVLVVAGLTFVLPAGALLWWRHSVFGLWLPNTAVAKRQEAPSLAMVGRIGEIVTAAGPVPLVAGAALLVLVVLLAVLGRRRERPLGRLAPVLGLAIPFVLAVAAFCILNRDWMKEYRFATPAAVTGSAMIGIGVCLLLRYWRGRLAQVLTVALTGAVVVASAVQTEPRMAQLLAAPSAPGCYVANRYGRTLNAAAAELGIHSGTLLVPDIGGVLMTSNFRVVDLLGLTEPTIARFKRDRDGVGLRRYILDQVKPTLVHYNVNLPGGDYGLARDRQFRDAYTPLIGDSDFVRTDAIPAGADLAAARRIAVADARTADRWRAESPRAGCGQLVPGQTVLRDQS